MKSIIAIAFAALFTLSAGVADAKTYHSYRHGHSSYRDNDRPRRVEARVQLRLRQLGYYHGPIDGSFGRQSRRALARFQRDHRLNADGRLDHRTLRALRVN